MEKMTVKDLPWQMKKVILDAAVRLPFAPFLAVITKNACRRATGTITLKKGEKNISKILNRNLQIFLEEVSHITHNDKRSRRYLLDAVEKKGIFCRLYDAGLNEKEIMESVSYFLAHELEKEDIKGIRAIAFNKVSTKNGAEIEIGGNPLSKIAIIEFKINYFSGKWPDDENLQKQMDFVYLSGAVIKNFGKNCIGCYHNLGFDYDIVRIAFRFLLPEYDDSFFDDKPFSYENAYEEFKAKWAKEASISIIEKLKSIGLSRIF